MMPSLPAPEVLPLSKEGEIEYPEIWKIHSASYLYSTQEVKDWAYSANAFKKRDLNRAILYSRPIEYEELSSSSAPPPRPPSLGEVILLRGSSRRFTRTPISFTQLSNILYSSTRHTA